MKHIREILRWIQVYANVLIVANFIERACPHFGNALVLAPHPDDEIMGVGAVMLNVLSQGSELNILYLTDGEASGAHSTSSVVRANRMAMSDEIRRAIGVHDSRVHRLGLPDGHIPQVGEARFGEVVGQVVDLIDRLRPDSVFATHSMDYWPFDHVACAELAKEAVRLSFHRPALYLYWVWAWYHQRPWELLLRANANLFAYSVAHWGSEKKNLVSLYLDRMGPDGIPWSGSLPDALRWSVGCSLEVIEEWKSPVSMGSEISTS